MSQQLSLQGHIIPLNKAGFFNLRLPMNHGRLSPKSIEIHRINGIFFLGPFSWPFLLLLWSLVPTVRGGDPSDMALGKLLGNFYTIKYKFKYWYFKKEHQCSSSNKWKVSPHPRPWGLGGTHNYVLVSWYQSCSSNLPHSSSNIGHGLLILRQSYFWQEFIRGILRGIQLKRGDVWIFLMDKEHGIGIPLKHFSFVLMVVIPKLLNLKCTIHTISIREGFSAKV